MLDVVALGELVIDFSPAGFSDEGNALYERHPGGAPSNLLAAVTKLGGKTALIGMVGEDEFGFFLRDTLVSCGVGTQGLRLSPDAYTTLAFVHLDQSGNRSFTVMRRPGADTCLPLEQVDFSLIGGARIFHVSAASLTHEPTRGSAFAAAKYARERGVPVSFDANYREVLWDAETARRVMREFLPLVDILKVSDEEMTLLSGTEDLAEGSRMLAGYGPKLVAVTLGPRGCFYRHPAGCGSLPAYDVKVVDTNGAGDIFLGSVLSQLCESGKPLAAFGREELEAIIRFANAAGSVCASRRGGLLSAPTREEVLRCMNGIPSLAV